MKTKMYKYCPLIIKNKHLKIVQLKEVGVNRF